MRAHLMTVKASLAQAFVRAEVAVEHNSQVRSVSVILQNLAALRFEIAKVTIQTSFGMLQLCVNQQVEPILELESTLRTVCLARFVRLILVGVQLVETRSPETTLGTSSILPLVHNGNVLCQSFGIFGKLFTANATHPFPASVFCVLSTFSSLRSVEPQVLCHHAIAFLVQPHRPLGSRSETTLFTHALR